MARQEQEQEIISLVELVGTEKASFEPVSVSRMGTYAKCNTAGYLKYREQARALFTAAPLWVGSRVHEGAENYYLGKAPTFFEGAMLALEKYTKDKGIEAHFDRALQVASLEADIIDKFDRGEITNPKGEKYTNPKMTKAYKELAESTGLYRLKASVSQHFKDAEIHPDDNLSEMVSRVLTLAERYQQSSIFTPREAFKTLWVERGFDFITKLTDGTPFRFKGFTDLVGELHEPDQFGNKWVLRDWKTGKGKGYDDSNVASHSSLQLTLYWFVCTHVWHIKAKTLGIELHFFDDCIAAPTIRSSVDWNMFLTLVEQYKYIKDTPGIPQRLFFDGTTCKGCDMRDVCIAKYGYGTHAADNYEAARVDKE